jgi:cytochrome c553
MDYVAPANQLVEADGSAGLGVRLVAEYGVNKDQLTNCAICHR